MCKESITAEGIKAMVERSGRVCVEFDVRNGLVLELNKESVILNAERIAGHGFIVEFGRTAHTSMTLFLREY